MKRRKKFISEKSEQDLCLISILSVVLCATVIPDSAIYFFTQVYWRGGIDRTETVVERVLLIVFLISFLLSAFAFMRILRRERSELRVQKTQYRMLQSMANVIAFEYDLSDDRMDYTYYEYGKEGGQMFCRDYYRGGGFRKTLLPEFWDSYDALFRRMLSGPVKDTCEFPMKMVVDEFRWYRFAYQSLADERGAIVSVVGSAMDVNDLVVARDKAREEAATDAMTGLLGKTAFAARASARMKNVKAEPATLLMIDLDNFKEINDTRGHLEGDRIISGIAALLQRVFSADDLIGRFGGDEFIVFMQGITQENTERKLLHFRRRLAELWEGRNYAITCSIGAFRDSGEDITFDELFQKADEAMYKAKNSGKNNFVIMDGYAPETSPSA